MGLCEKRSGDSHEESVQNFLLKRSNLLGLSERRTEPDSPLLNLGWQECCAEAELQRLDSMGAVLAVIREFPKRSKCEDTVIRYTGHSRWWKPDTVIRSMDKRISQLDKSEPGVNRRLPMKNAKEESQDIGRRIYDGEFCRYTVGEVRFTRFLS